MMIIGVNSELVHSEEIRNLPLLTITFYWPTNALNCIKLKV